MDARTGLSKAIGDTGQFRYGYIIVGILSILLFAALLLMFRFIGTLACIGGYCAFFGLTHLTLKRAMRKNDNLAKALGANFFGAVYSVLSFSVSVDASHRKSQQWRAHRSTQTPSESPTKSRPAPG